MVTGSVEVNSADIKQYTQSGHKTVCRTQTFLQKQNRQKVGSQGNKFYKSKTTSYKNNNNKKNLLMANCW